MIMRLKQYSYEPIANYNDGTGEKRCIKEFKGIIKIVGIDYEDCYNQYIELLKSTDYEFEIID